MSILDKLYGGIKVVSAHERSTIVDINELLLFSPIGLPDEYVELSLLGSFIEILISDKSYICLWGANKCILMNDEYKVQSDIPLALAIGDDGGGGALFYVDGFDGVGVYHMRYEDMDMDEATYISESLSALLTKGIGLDVLISVI